LGGLIGAGRFATIFALTLALQPPAVAYAFLLPGFAVHTTFGVLSGIVTYQLAKRLRRPGVNESVTGGGAELLQNDANEQARLR
jgi:hypothetical protein